MPITAVASNAVVSYAVIPKGTAQHSWRVPRTVIGNFTPIFFGGGAMAVMSHYYGNETPYCVPCGVYTRVDNNVYSSEGAVYRCNSCGQSYTKTEAAPQSNSEHVQQPITKAKSSLPQICPKCGGGGGFLSGMFKFAKWRKCNKCKGLGKLLLA